MPSANIKRRIAEIGARKATRKVRPSRDCSKLAAEVVQTRAFLSQKEAELAAVSAANERELKQRIGKINENAGRAMREAQATIKAEADRQIQAVERELGCSPELAVKRGRKAAAAASSAPGRGRGREPAAASSDAKPRRGREPAAAAPAKPSRQGRGRKPAAPAATTKPGRKAKVSASTRIAATAVARKPAGRPRKGETPEQAAIRRGWTPSEGAQIDTPVRKASAKKASAKKAGAKKAGAKKAGAKKAGARKGPRKPPRKTARKGRSTVDAPLEDDEVLPSPPAADDDDDSDDDKFMAAFAGALQNVPPPR